MALTPAGIHRALDGLAADTTHISLHTADPSTTGANEVTGGTPAYTREVPTFAAAASSNVSLNGTLSFDVPAGTTVRYFGLWDGATFLGGNAVSAVETFAAQGVYQLTDIDVAGAGV